MKKEIGQFDRSAFKGGLVTVDKENRVWFIKRDELSEQQKAELAMKRNAKHARKMAQRSEARNAMISARKKARKDPSVVNSEAYEAAVKRYEELMGRR